MVLAHKGCARDSFRCPGHTSFHRNLQRGRHALLYTEIVSHPSRFASAH